MDVVEFTQKLVSIESESGNEDSIANYLANFLKANGFKVKIQKVDDKLKNVIACRGDFKKARLLLNSHLDTVPIGDLKKWKKNPLGQKSSGKLYGRGTTDTKGSLASMTFAAIESDRKDVMLAFTADEETGEFRGSRTLFKHRKKYPMLEASIVGEPSMLRAIVAHKGFLGCYINIFGKAAHGSRPDLGDNAIYKAIKLIKELEDWSKKVEHKDSLLGKSTHNIGEIKGGTAMNIIPDFCRFSFEMRILPKHNIKKLWKELTALVNKYKGKMDTKAALVPLFTSIDSKITNIVFKALKKNKLSVKPQILAGATEAAFISDRFKIPSIVFGPGDIKLAHQIDEYVEIKQIKKSVDVLKEIIETF